MNTNAHADELAHRLTQAEAGRFRAQGDTVILDGAVGDTGRIQVIDAGSGRTQQTMQALRRTRESPHVPLIAGRHFSEHALAELNSADANYMDDRHLRVRLLTPNILIRLQEQAPTPEEPPAKNLRLSGAAGGVALALLSDPSREWKVSDLANEGRVSLGAAQNTVVSLESDGLLERSGRGPATRRRVTDPAGLLDLYARDAAADRKVIVRGFLLDRGTEETMIAASRLLTVEAPGLSVWFTGVAAAQMVAPHVTSVRVFEAWVTTPHRADHILKGMGAMPVDEGSNLVVMRGHKGVTVGSECCNGVRRVSVFRMYADALADPARGEEQAEHLRETVIGF
ncbi:MAG: hypothetical protein U1E26_08550 [Coriobacteriia bacterium]|nr:hypothetical protein [Coriobacteriia bacterium]